MLRKESLGGPERLRLVTSASTMTTSGNSSSSSGGSSSGLRQPTTYYHRSNTYQEGLSAAYSPTSPNPMQSRLPQLQSSIPSMDHGQYTRMRRQSVVQKPPSSPARPVRSRTMSDAGSSLPRCTPSATTTTRKPDLRRSVLAPDSFISNFNAISSDEEEEEEEMAPRRYRASAPVLNAYGMPTSSSSAAIKSRRSIGALKSSSAQQNSRLDNLPPSDLDQKIRVCVRKRPLSKKETERCEKDIAETIGTRSILINEPK